MNRARFTFKKYKNSFSVHVDNLEQLSVQEIQKIQKFVSDRKGVFDFSTYTFSIQKRLELDEFVSILKYSGLEAISKEEETQINQDARVEFGKYRGMLYSDLPDNYLVWLNSNYCGKDREIISAELKSRSLFLG